MWPSLTPTRLVQNDFWPFLQTVPSQQKELQLSPRAGWPHRCLTHSDQLPQKQCMDHRAISDLALKHKASEPSRVWEMGALSGWCQAPTSTALFGRASCVLFPGNYCLHTLSTGNKLVLPEDVQPRSRSLESQFQIASRHQIHTGSRIPLQNSSPGLISSQAS